MLSLKIGPDPPAYIVRSISESTSNIFHRRFIQVVKCCIYFAEKHQGNSSPTPTNHTSSNMVTLLTSDSSMSSAPGNSTKMANLGTRVSQYALEICKTKGIRVEPVVDFYKRWDSVLYFLTLIKGTTEAAFSQCSKYFHLRKGLSCQPGSNNRIYVSKFSKVRRIWVSSLCEIDFRYDISQRVLFCVLL